MEVSPKLKMAAPKYANAKETFIRLDKEIEKLMGLKEARAISESEMCIKSILQALLIQIPAIAHDVRGLAVNGRYQVETAKRQSAINQALENIKRLEQEAEAHGTPADSVPAPRPKAKKATRAKKTEEKSEEK